MDKNKAHQIVRNKEIESEIRQGFEQSLSEKVKRSQLVSVPWLLPNHHFAPFSAECTLLFRDGYFYSCIVAVQSIAEATVRFLCEANGWSPKKEFETNVEDLLRRRFISPQARKSLLEIWKDRNDYHHLNAVLKSNPKRMGDAALSKLNQLGRLQQEIFGFDIVKGRIRPKNNKYWKSDAGQELLGFLQIEPITKWEFKGK